MLWLTRILDALEALGLCVERLVLWAYRPFQRFADFIFGIKRCPHCGGGHGRTLPDWCTYCYKLTDLRECRLHRVGSKTHSAWRQTSGF